MTDMYERAVRKLEAGSPKRDVGPKKRVSKVHTPEVKQQKFELDFSSLQGKGIITPENLQSRVAEEYRIIKRLILMSVFGKGVPKVEGGNIVVIVSALEGEGKTFSSLNLAISIAQERDSTVLLVDADLTRRTLSQMFHADRAKGLSDLLIETDADPAAVIAHTNIEKLRFIPAGSPQTNAAELLASSQMEQLATELMNRYEDRVILFDSPPLLGTSQAAVLTQLAGQVLMVVEEGRTPQSVVREANDIIDGDKLVGMILNRCTGSKSGSYYGGYYAPQAGTEG